MSEENPWPCRLVSSPKTDPDTSTQCCEELEENGDMEEEEGGSLSPKRGSTDESDESDSLEPEPPAVIRRKVSFADAFGLDLVYIKEFDSTDQTGGEGTDTPEPMVKVNKEVDEYFLSSLFTVPSSPEELEQRLQDQKLELESIELLPGTTTLRGIVRVSNLCYNKSLYVRITLDSWKTYFDLLAEFVPGSSDGATDRFVFRLTLVPPFEIEGARVEFCLRYETTVGTFWANNNDLNYVLFCHKKGGRDLIEVEPQSEDGKNNREKRSCLKSNSKKNSAVEKSKASTTDTPDSATYRAEGTGGKTVENAERLPSDLQHEDYHRKHLVRSSIWTNGLRKVESQKSRRRAARLTRLQDYLYQREQDSRQGHISNGLLPHDRLENPPTEPHIRIKPVGGSTSSQLRLHQKKQANETAQILMYHQIPLLSLDWRKDNVQGLSPDQDDIRTETRIPPQVKPDESEDILGEQSSVADLWEAFLCGTDCNDVSCISDSKNANHSPESIDARRVSESDWLHSATSVCQSDETEVCESSSKVENKQVEDVASNPQICSHPTVSGLQKAHNNEMPVEPLPSSDVTFPGDDKALVYDPYQMSEVTSVTNTPQESIPSITASHTVGNMAQCHRHVGVASGELPFTLYGEESLTTLEEIETTDTTVLAEFSNANAADRIFRGESQFEMLSCDMEAEVINNVEKSLDENEIIGGTIRERTEDKTNTHSCGEEEEFIKTYIEYEVCSQNKKDENELTQDLTEDVMQRQIEAVKDDLGTNQRDHINFESNLTGMNDSRPCQMYEDEFRLKQTEKDKSSPNQSVDEFTPKQTNAQESRTNRTVFDVFNLSQSEIEEINSYKTEKDKISLSHHEENYNKIHTHKDMCLNRNDKQLDRDNKAFSETFSPNQTTNVKCRLNELDKFTIDDENREKPYELNELRSIQTHEDVFWSKKILVKDNYQTQSEDELHKDINTDSSTRGQSYQSNFREEKMAVLKTENVMDEISRQRNTERVYEEISIKTPENEKGKDRTEKTVNTEHVSTGMEEELDVAMENVECPRQDKNGTLSVGTEELIIKDNKESFAKDVESGENELFTEQKGLNEEMVEKVLDFQLVNSSPSAERDNVIALKKDIMQKLTGELKIIQKGPIHQKTCTTKSVATDIDSCVDSLTKACTDPDLTFKQMQCQIIHSSNAEPSMGQTHESSPERVATVLAPLSSLSTRSNKMVTKGCESGVGHWSTQNTLSSEGDQVTLSSQTPPSEKVEDAANGVLAWGKVFFSLSSIKRAMVYSLIVAVFFFTNLVYDFPACFALYLFSLYWQGCSKEGKVMTIQVALKGRWP
ncbi:hypothetical protein UPYG_G00344190 [Umbra pygmaea]|uniref:CBM21 domain-containing protein n=1 Tax=Umbra pygmaea TaxID=75934 RepID=A0ABD0WJC9_UMBPY